MTSHCFLRLLNHYHCYNSCSIYLKLSNVFAINCSRIYRCVGVYIYIYIRCACRGVCGMLSAGDYYSSAEAATTAAFASSFLLYLLCKRGSGDDGGRETRVWGDIFHRAMCLQLLFQRKFANGSPLSPLVQRSCAGDFFSPTLIYICAHDVGRTLTYVEYVRHDFYALTPTNGE